MVPRLVTAVHRLFAGIVTLRVGGQTIETTAEHPFFVAGVGWRRARQLTPGDQLLGADGETTTVDAVFPAERTAPVFNLRVEVDHTYFVGTPAWGFSVWVHNAYIARQSADGKWEIYDDVKKKVPRSGIESDPAAKEIARQWNDLLDDQDRYRKILTAKVGPAPKGMHKPHAHHILQKKGNGPEQWALVEEGQAILREVGIDPINGPENLCWAPNGVKDQHSTATLREVVEALRDLKAQGASKRQFAVKLKELGQLAANRR